MPSRKQSSDPKSTPPPPAAKTPEAREQQMIDLADRLAEKQLLDGTASSQVMTHYLKLGTSREKLEQEKIRNENLRIEAQILQIQSQAKAEERMLEVLSAIKRYSGEDEEDEYV